MRNFDMTPLYRATVGFDQIADIMDRVFTNDVSRESYPPYNIEKTAEDGWRISVAVAGFTFERRFHLADHVRVTGATHENGMLHVDLVREVPEALKPRRIEIGRANGAKAIEGKTVETANA